MGIIKINCNKVYNTGDEYKKSSEEISNYKQQLNEIYTGIEEAWNNDENVNFLASFKDHIDKLDEYISFLDETGDNMKKVAIKHNDSELEFKRKMESSDLDEDEYEY